VPEKGFSFLNPKLVFAQFPYKIAAQTAAGAETHFRVRLLINLFINGSSRPTNGRSAFCCGLVRQSGSRRDAGTGCGKCAVVFSVTLKSAGGGASATS
jgi:hypothetical protein